MKTYWRIRNECGEYWGNSPYLDFDTIGGAYGFDTYEHAKYNLMDALAKDKSAHIVRVTVARAKKAAARGGKRRGKSQ